MRKLLLLASTLLIFAPLQAQSSFVPINSDYEHLIDRFEIKSGRIFPKLHTQLKPFSRKVIAEMADSVWSGLTSLSIADRFNLDYLKNDSWEWSTTAESDSKKPILKHLYRKKSDFYQFQNNDFDLHINPILHGFVGYDRDNDETPFMNTRGVELRGMIARKLGFYTYFTDTQATFPAYVVGQINQLNAVPNEGYFKRNIGNDGVDFLTARGYITFDVIKNIVNLQFGYDKNFVGHGYRSMILSDFSSNYLFLKLNTNVWRINYQNIFGQLTADVFNADGFFPQKYFALHHLSINITKNFNLGLFESIVFNRGDSSAVGNRSGSFDLRYLNPLIFYRSIEQQAGSPDNAVLGMDFKWNLWKKLSLYGQLVIDEFVLSEIRDWNGWRGNKQSGQLGLKYVDVAGVDNLDLQTEVNIARPYMYSHNFQYGEFSNYNQALAHPLGANFYEFIGIMRYQPFKRLNLSGKMIYADYGTDPEGQNWGQNIFLDNSTFEQEYGNRIGQGIETKLLFLDITATWQIRHNMFVDLKQIYRKLNSTQDNLDKTTVYFAFVFRWNVPQRLYEF